MRLENRIKDVLSSCTTWDQLLVGIRYCWALMDLFKDEIDLPAHIHLFEIYNIELKESARRIGGSIE